MPSQTLQKKKSKSGVEIFFFGVQGGERLQFQVSSMQIKLHFIPGYFEFQLL